MRAVLAEDDKGNREFITVLLNAIGYDDVVAFDAVDKALVYLAECRGVGVDVVLLDRHTLGRMDGLEALRVNMMQDFPEIPALLCSHEAKDHKKRLREDGYGATTKLGLTVDALLREITEAKELRQAARGE